MKLNVDWNFLKWFSLIPILFIVFFHFYRSSFKESADLIIGVLSKRDNFLQRKTIRETWYSYVQSIKAAKDQTLKIFFILGQECLVPSQYKKEPYTCEFLKINETEDLKNEIQIQKVSQNARKPVHLYKGFSFQVYFDIIITSIGALSSVAEPNLEVFLIDVLTKKQIVYKRLTNFSQFSNGFYYEKLNPYIILPKGFTAALIVNTSFDIKCNPCFNSWNDYTNLVKVLRVYDDFNDYLSETFNKNQIFASSMIFTALNKANLIKYSQNWLNVLSYHLETMASIKAQIEKESAIFKDLIFIESVDTYRNLPEKVISFISLMNSKYNFKYLLKTDDDCFIDLNLVIKFLSEIKNEYQIWWGNFRKHWLVDLYGKWAESEYQSSVYPSFACGSGYVISADIAAWLSLNKDALHRYQGEDVSMGIWLSALYPRYIQDNRWLCEPTSYVSHNIYSKCQLNISQIIEFFNNNKNKIIK